MKLVISWCDTSARISFSFFLSFFLLPLFSFKSQSWRFLTRKEVVWREVASHGVKTLLLTYLVFFFLFFSLLQVFHDLNGISWAWSRLWKEQTWYMGTASITVRSLSPLLRARTKKKKKKSIVILEYESNRSVLRAEKQNTTTRRCHTSQTCCILQPVNSLLEVTLKVLYFFRNYVIFKFFLLEKILIHPTALCELGMEISRLSFWCNFLQSFLKTLFF